MKKSIIVVGMAAVLLMLVASCKKENSSKVVLRAGIEDTPSKTYVNITGPWTNWEDTDHIMVNGNEMYLTKKYEGRTGVFDHADFTCDNWIGDLPNGSIQLYAVSPATEQQQNTDGTWKSKISLPATQPYIANGFMGDLPMAISNMGTSLNFHNLTCVFGVPVRTDVENGLNITKVELTCADSPIPLVAQVWWPHWGQESLDLNNVEIIGNPSRTITLDCGNGVLVPTTTEGIEFFFAAFPVLPKDSKLDISFYQGETLVATIQKTLSGKTEPNMIYDLVESPDNNNRTPWTINPTK